MSKRKIILITIGLVLVILPALSVFFTDWMWFASLGYESVFLTFLEGKIFTGLVVGIFFFLFLFLNFSAALKITEKKGIAFGKIPDFSKNAKKMALGISLAAGFFAGLAGSQNWQIVLKYLNAASFGQTDPVLGKDISYYFFSLPFFQMVSGILLSAAIVSLIGCVLIYLAKESLPFLNSKIRKMIYSFDGEDEFGKVQKRSRIHIFSLLSFIFLIFSFQTWYLKIPQLLYSETGPFLGASFTDVASKLPALKILSFILLFAAAASFLNIFQKKLKMIALALILYLLVLVGGTVVYPFILQKFVVEPNELSKESPYIAYNIEATQKGFNIDEIQEKELPSESVLTINDIEANQATIKNIRLWDREPLLDTFGQVQEIRTYYDFLSIDNDRYQLNGDYRQILLSARELNSDSLPNPNFINKHLTFTHGFGLTVSPVNEVTAEGLPVLFVKDLPPASVSDSLEVTRPEIYYGELTDEYAVVKTKAKEFNYPAGEENVFTEYEGDGGVVLDSFFKKVLFAIRFGEIKLLFSSDITQESRIMFDRNIKERVEKLLPFLVFDEDPYLVIAEDGSLKWIYDAYTTSHLYPYSERVGKSLTSNGINYIRNSVKAVLDAYTGKVTFYISDQDDPLIQTYASIFPGTFLPLDSLSQDLKDHLRYPEDIFTYQTAVYTVYHMEEPQIFYNKEDQWQIPRISEDRSDPMMRHMVMKLPGEEKEEFILMIPFTPKMKDNLSAWMVARSDGDNYGKIVVYRFPKQRLVYGPEQIINRINQDPEIARQISLWDQRGSQVNQGPLLVIPIKESLLYIRPLYLKAEGGKIPELKRVIAAYENEIVMEETLEKAIEAIFKGKKDDSAPEEPLIEDLALQAQTLYSQALEALSAGNWALYGQKIEELGLILQKLQ